MQQKGKLTLVYRNDKINLLEYQRYGRNKETIINKKYIESGVYRSKFDCITDNKKVNRVLYRKAKEMLFHRSGTVLEDMYWIDFNTGNVVLCAKEEKEPGKIVYSEKMKRIIEKKYDLITLHTHPNSMPPSIADFNSAYRHRYIMNLVICHNGKIFSYNASEKISEKLYALYIKENILGGFSEYEAQLNTLNKLKLSYNITFWEV